MRILLTGGRGMVGRNFLEHPKARDHDIQAPGSAELDLRDAAAVRSWLAASPPDIIIHAAGRVGGIQANLREPVAFLVDNLDIGRNLVLAAREYGVKALLNLGSSCMYPRNGTNPLHEELILQGELEPTNEGYALAKITVAKLCEYITRETPDYQYKTLIPCNIYGRHDKFSPDSAHMLPSIIRKLHEAKTSGRTEVEIWGSGEARREFMYAGDLADCMWRAVEQFESLPPLMNVGLGRDWTVNEYYAIAARVIGYSGRFTHDLTKPVGMLQKLVSIERSARWGWCAKTPLEKGIEITYDHYLKGPDR